MSRIAFINLANTSTPDQMLIHCFGDKVSKEIKQLVCTIADRNLINDKLLNVVISYIALSETTVIKEKYFVAIIEDLLKHNVDSVEDAMEHMIKHRKTYRRG